jgi:hypothetical protein
MELQRASRLIFSILKWEEVKLASNFTQKKLLAAKPRIQTIAGDESSETAHYHPTIPELTILCTRKAPAADPIPKHPLKFPKRSELCKTHY